VTTSGSVPSPILVENASSVVEVRERSGCLWFALELTELVHAGTEQVCPKVTYSIPGFGPAPYGRGKAGAAGSQPKGGFANYWRGPAKFAIPIPKGMDLASAAPMLCGGITMYGPLERKGAGKTAKRVGIVGIGGLGHFGILFAKSMGAEVTAISRSRDKEADAKELGADHFIAMSEGADDYKNTLDLILCTISRYSSSCDSVGRMFSLIARIYRLTHLNQLLRVSTRPLTWISSDLSETSV
jgi:D-arabinose 1-dehydrogenase-like Zn-dependent alcohol dehydrogenase